MAALDTTQFGIAIDKLYEAAAVPALWPSALERLGRAAGGAHSLALYAPPSRSEWFACSPGLDDCLHAFFAEGWAARNARITRGLEAGQAVFSEETIFAPGELDRAPIQREFFDRFGLRSFIGFDFVPGRILGSIERGHHPAAAWELEAIRRAVPHFRRIGTLASARGLGLTDGVVSGLDAMNAGALVVDHNGQVLRTNARADALCAAVMTIRWGTMRLRHHAAAPLFDRMVLQAVSPRATQAVDVVDLVALPREGRRPLLAQAIPLRGCADDLFQQAKAIVLLVDPEAGADADEACLARAFGLTGGEARVAARIAQGLSAVEAAQALDVAADTVRSHLKSIFLKTDTHRQAELVALLCKVPHGGVPPASSRGGPQSVNHA